MSITILNYHDQAFVDQINAEAAARAEAERAAAEAAKAQAASSDFSSVLTNATDAYSAARPAPKTFPPSLMKRRTPTASPPLF